LRGRRFVSSLRDLVINGQTERLVSAKMKSSDDRASLRSIFRHLDEFGAEC
jgi:hypothetical protein